MLMAMVGLMKERYCNIGERRRLCGFYELVVDVVKDSWVFRSLFP